MNYVDKGSNDENIILSVHGIFGGYDQGYDAYKDFRDSSDSNNNNNNNNNNNYRIIAPSRFGYLGSDIMGNGTPKEQAKAYIELLNNLKIDKVFVLATSAGGSPAIRFALDYPERVKGLILYCSAMPFYEKPKKIIKYAGPPPFICNNFLMFLMKPLFKLIMGMEPSTIYSILPINDRKNGVIIDASITNLDMAKNYDEYAVEKLKVPTIVFQAKDDKLINYIDTEKSIKRFPNCTFISFENGGHLMTGHEEEIRKEVSKFVSTYH
ncbi:alpha/beta hydrolase fold protein [Anaeromyces robustus]|uniref:Alpha/beta hydrolase fold protein n=1 Tax=Anaeromyces robustus TaxID=1754192 RepID=A0A1Y1WZM1_9FUNG|nr:alpha/beta hydrolase fold protein [Anaeromyces robustus]|eukprot:ORX78636.1 alpha/beta hydrolase fold protein [Anaeromyces robustus]